MVEVKVLRVFNDKDVNSFTKLGEIIKKPKERAEELAEGGFVKILSEKEAEPEKPKEKSKPTTKEEKKFD